MPRGRHHRITRRGRALGITLLVVTVAAAAAAAWSYHRRGVVYRMGGALFGPPAVTPTEAYGHAGAATFDHALFDALLRRVVDADGRVDYASLTSDRRDLDAYLASLATAPFDAMSRDARLALLINAYNACTIRLILDHWPLDSIRDIPDAERWDAVRWTVAGRTWSLNQIEHEQIRPKFAEPRIHFALVCAAVSCPPLRRESYEAARIEAQLGEQAALVHADARWFAYDAASDEVHLTMLYHPSWYGGDFTATAPSVLAYAARYSPALAARLERGGEPSIRWIDYDWALNGRGAAASGG